MGIIIQLALWHFTVSQAILYCPQSTDDWNKASVSLQCREPNYYHCLKDDNGTFQQLCLQKVWIQEGMCPEYNSKVRQIDVYDCISDFNDCPTATFWSSAVYLCMYSCMFPIIFMILIFVLFLYGMSSSVNTDLKNSGEKERDNMESIIAIAACSAILIIIVIVLLVNVFIWRRRRIRRPQNREIRRIHSNTEDRDTENNLLTTRNDDIDGFMDTYGNNQEMETMNKLIIEGEQMHVLGKNAGTDADLLEEYGVLILISDDTSKNDSRIKSLDETGRFGKSQYVGSFSNWDFEEDVSLYLFRHALDDINSSYDLKELTQKFQEMHKHATQTPSSYFVLSFQTDKWKRFEKKLSKYYFFKKAVNEVAKAIQGERCFNDEGHLNLNLFVKSSELLIKKKRWRLSRATLWLVHRPRLTGIQPPLSLLVLLPGTYHCLKTTSGRYIEKCLEKTWIPPDMCPEYNEQLNIMDVDKCLGDSTECPRNTYWSNAVYIYPTCFQKSQSIQNSTYITYTHTNVTEESSNSTSSSNMTTRSSDLDIQTLLPYIIGGSVLVFLILVAVFICVLCRRKRSRHKGCRHEVHIEYRKTLRQESILDDFINAEIVNGNGTIVRNSSADVEKQPFLEINRKSADQVKNVFIYIGDDEDKIAESYEPLIYENRYDKCQFVKGMNEFKADIYTKVYFFQHVFADVKSATQIDALREDFDKIFTAASQQPSSKFVLEMPLAVWTEHKTHLQKTPLFHERYIIIV
ncbi:uncharacterized protein LOC134233743 [Saccostrea cucullata]|uniref:uncharacterized protein LOC134233743 n=1 Tax=Saccostrea cuccullata TaxID=36930 RepID=UPI002ED051C1